MKNRRQLYKSGWFPIHLIFPSVIRPKILNKNGNLSISLGWFYIKCRISPFTDAGDIDADLFPFHCSWYYRHLNAKIGTSHLASCLKHGDRIMHSFKRKTAWDPPSSMLNWHGDPAQIAYFPIHVRQEKSTFIYAVFVIVHLFKT